MPKNTLAYNYSPNLTVPKRTGQFVQIPLELIRESEISPAALKLYMILLSYSGVDNCAYPSQSRLAIDMKLTERRVRTLLVELLEANLVEIIHRAGTSNLYIPLWKAGREVEENFRRERKNSSDNLHEHDLNHVCEKNSVSETIPDTDTGIASKVTLAENTQNDKQISTLLISAGISLVMAQELARVIRQNNRDISYVKLLIETSQEKYIHNPIGFIRFMILRNAEPVNKPVSTRPKQRKSPPSASQTPLDFSKYLTGKYAYLTGTTSGEETIPNTNEEEAQILWQNLRRTLALSGEFPLSILDSGRLRYCSETGRYLPVFVGREDLNSAQGQVLGKALENLLLTGSGYNTTPNTISLCNADI
ncbi:MAG: helix-turn-helix domain-containing protein [Chloroflexi bacterium]|uniref:Helix-turn-helix domain-containing protein n=1 Tax=Candidatus Chlorohelix allophototropha TaxID=3003348 RepID=A0A8T7M3X8_9CHLR|nr:helix-turn-helix domain-containing protein [Chloroflexota bacterium]WJW70225.1 helix-turn-helix domain-containing protein [Chloroflexota bacterium L227-S17]